MNPRSYSTCPTLFTCCTHPSRPQPCYHSIHVRILANNGDSVLYFSHLYDGNNTSPHIEIKLCLTLIYSILYKTVICHYFIQYVLGSRRLHFPRLCPSSLLFTVPIHWIFRSIGWGSWSGLYPVTIPSCKTLPLLDSSGTHL